MKGSALIVALCLFFAAMTASAVPVEDKEYRAGLKYYNSRDYKAAVKHLQEYVKEQPDPTAYYLIGYSLYKLGKFDEAEENFRQAYFIAPDFSPEKVELVKKQSPKTMAPGIEKPQQEASAGPTAIPPGPSSKPSPALASGVTPIPAKPLPAVPAGPKAVTPAPPAPTQAKPAQEAPVGSNTPAPLPTPKSSPSQVVPAPRPMPSEDNASQSMPKPKMVLPAAALPSMIGLVAAFGIFFVVIVIAVYIYAGLCLFLIAKRLNVPAPWTAWVPLVNLWTIVACAGKPAWWLVFLIIPLVSLFVFVYLYLCITENLGKNKWLGLLMLVPGINLIFLGWLAFSKTESSGMPVTE